MLDPSICTKCRRECGIFLDLRYIPHKSCWHCYKTGRGVTRESNPPADCKYLFEQSIYMSVNIDKTGRKKNCVK